MVRKEKSTRNLRMTPKWYRTALPVQVPSCYQVSQAKSQHDEIDLWVKRPSGVVLPLVQGTGSDRCLPGHYGNIRWEISDGSDVCEICANDSLAAKFGTDQRHPRPYWRVARCEFKFPCFEDCCKTQFFNYTMPFRIMIQYVSCFCMMLHASAWNSWVFLHDLCRFSYDIAWFPQNWAQLRTIPPKIDSQVEFEKIQRLKATLPMNSWRSSPLDLIKTPFPCSGWSYRTKKQFPASILDWWLYGMWVWSKMLGHMSR